MKEYFDSPSSSISFGAPGTENIFLFEFHYGAPQRTLKNAMEVCTLNRPLVDSVKIQWDERSHNLKMQAWLVWKKTAQGPELWKKLS